jgi:hypothetical protein
MSSIHPSGVRAISLPTNLPTYLPTHPKEIHIRIRHSMLTERLGRGFDSILISDLIPILTRCGFLSELSFFPL